MVSFTTAYAVSTTGVSETVSPATGSAIGSSTCVSSTTGVSTTGS